MTVKRPRAVPHGLREPADCPPASSKPNSWLNFLDRENGKIQKRISAQRRKLTSIEPRAFFRSTLFTPNPDTVDKASAAYSFGNISYRPRKAEHGVRRSR